MAEIFSVSQVNTYIGRLFSGNSLLNRIAVKGEVSNCKYHTSGHLYFTLKDKAAQIACVMFAGRRAGISFRMEDGQSVVVFGSIGVYEQGGKYQLYAEEVRLDGIGRLYEEFEYLKQKLRAEGLFDAGHKKQLKRYVRTVGIVTARTGAAIQDIMQISRRRNPYVQLLLYPAKVQGEGAADTIVAGIQALDGKADVIIVGRGGGSIEDLWAFNEEKVARAIYECGTPVISAVGHETDTTIADFVADLRAPTPSAAAELAVYDILQLEQTLAGLHSELAEALCQRIEETRRELKQKELCLRQYHPRVQLRQKQQWLADNGLRLSELMSDRLKDCRHRLALLTQRLKGVSPLTRLSGGYAFVTNEAGEAVTGTDKVAAGSRIRAELCDGSITATVTQVDTRVLEELLRN